MIVRGYRVPQEVEDACLQTMQDGQFRASYIFDTAARLLPLKLPQKKLICAGIADRLIQRERQANRIMPLHTPYWAWVHGA